jgi:hypothetical protein
MSMLSFRVSSALFVFSIVLSYISALIHLQLFYLKHGICQLTDHEYDISMHIFCKYLVTVLLINY